MKDGTYVVNFDYGSKLFEFSAHKAKSGFYVSCADFETRINRFIDLSGEAIGDILQAYGSLIITVPHGLLGIWTGDDGTRYFDVTEHLTGELADALRIARERNQVAIWDITNNKAITIGESNG